MTWLAVSGAVFIVWLILVFLFTPGINYRLARRTSIHDADFLYTIQSTCQTALHHGNAVTVYTNGEQFYPAMLDAIRGATRSINMECYIFQDGRVAKRFIDALSERARNGVNVTIGPSAGCARRGAGSSRTSGCAGTRCTGSTTGRTGSC